MAYRNFVSNLTIGLLFLCGRLDAAHGQTLAPTPAPAPQFSALNEAFGLPIWSDDSLWDDSTADVATRLKWPNESRTDSDESYRLYAHPGTLVLGARPFSLALYGKDGKASQISMVFANKGDVGQINPSTHRLMDDYKKQIMLDARTIEQTLSKVLGTPKVDQFGQGVRTREQVDRWDWKGHSILLAAPRGEYVAVRIVPTAMLDAGAQARVTGLDLRAKLRARVEHRPNGDVVLRDMPMVDQGPKGYCVPATWERALRYMGIPADMYVLAMAGQTEAGGGTSLDGMSGGAKEILAANGRRLVPLGGRISPQFVAKFIDDGVPILWGMYYVFDLEQSVTTRSMQRRSVTDWTAYMEMLKPWRRNAYRIRPSRENAHMCMIIGYNSKTDEIAISDSWGPQFAERWITQEEANAVSQDQFDVIDW
jgi:hypothetical protein